MEQSRRFWVLGMEDEAVEAMARHLDSIGAKGIDVVRTCVLLWMKDLDSSSPEVMVLKVYKRLRMLRVSKAGVDDWVPS